MLTLIKHSFSQEKLQDFNLFCILPAPSKINFLNKIFNILFILERQRERERERQNMSGGGAEQEKDTESKASSGH